jgi:hypothetical protein
MLPEPDSYVTLDTYLRLYIDDSNKLQLPIKLNEELLKPLVDKYNLPQQTLGLIHHIVVSIVQARNGQSKIDPNTNEGKEILEYDGYTGTRTRHLYNNICNSDALKNIKYLEIGTWNGSSSISAVYKNNITGLFIDNWSQFGGDSQKFIDSMSKFGKSSSNFLLESDCWKVNLQDLDMVPFNIYLFDGDHSELNHFKSLEYYYPVLDDTFIFLVDDWNWPNVRDGTMRAIDQLNLNVLFRHEEFVSQDELHNMPNHYGKKTWWNGMACFLLSKTLKK